MSRIGDGAGETVDVDGMELTMAPLEWRFSQAFGERTVGEEVQEVDIISAIEYDKSGNHLATGDRGGRVVLFERTDVRELGSRRDLEMHDHPVSRHPKFQYKTEFQSHEPEFDYLKSLEIEEKINKIRWCQSVNDVLFLLATNDKTIKYWKVQEKKVKIISEMNIDTSHAATNGSFAGPSTSTNFSSLPDGGYSERPYGYLSNGFSFPTQGFPSLRLPVVASHERNLLAQCRRVYAHAHDYHINSISNNSDGATFISADDLRINLWNLEISNQSFNIVDLKPANMEDLTEVITSAEFHPTHCNTLAYSSSKGSIRLIDLRQSALCDNPTQLFEEQEIQGSRSFFTEIIASISDIKFRKNGRHILSRDYMNLKVITSAEFHPTHCNTLAYSSSKGSIRLIDLRQSALCDNPTQLFEEQEIQGSRSFFTEIIASISDIKFRKNGRHILSRDYMNLKLWDINMNSGPVLTFQVHEYLRPKLCDLYENDSIFDKFECCMSGDGLRVATGSYSNLFRVFGCTTGGNEATTLQASKDPTRRLTQVPARPERSLSSITRAVWRGAENSRVDSNGNSYDFTSKLLHLAWHPTENVIACAAANSLYMYYA